MTQKQDYGKQSEKRAEAFLRKQHHRILERNYRTRQGEVDLITLTRDGTLVFTEVRSRHSLAYGHPVETVDQKKQARIRAAARQFLYEHPKYADSVCRFDVVTLVGEGKEAVLEHFPDAF